MVSFNRVILAGNLTRDPELRFTNDGVPVCSFGLAVNRVFSKNEEVDFFNVSAWRGLGERAANYQEKGDPVPVAGRLQYPTREAPDGSRRGAVGIVAVNRVFSKNEEVDFFNVSAWRDLGERVANYKKKGDPVLVEGRLQYRTWEAQDGSKRSAVDIVADNVQFLGRAGDPQEAGAPAGGQSRRGQGSDREEVDVNEEDFEDIPFAHFNIKPLIARGIL